MSLLFFFFSSRRRHTRFDCDWSSDVCSSDLLVRGSPAWEADAHAQSGAIVRVIADDAPPMLAHHGRHDGQAQPAARHRLVGRAEKAVEYTAAPGRRNARSEEHTSELQSQSNLVCRLLLEKKKNNKNINI